MRPAYGCYSPAIAFSSSHVSGRNIFQTADLVDKLKDFRSQIYGGTADIFWSLSTRAPPEYLTLILYNFYNISLN